MNPRDPGFFQADDDIQQLELMQALARTRWPLDPVSQLVILSRTDEGFLFDFTALEASVRGGTSHPWQLRGVAGEEGTVLGRIALPLLHDAPAADATIDVTGGADITLEADIKFWLRVQFNTDGDVTSAAVESGADWWSAHPAIYVIAEGSPDYQSDAYVPIAQIVADPEAPNFADLPRLTAEWRVRQFVTTALELVDVCVDGTALRLPRPGPAAT
jgi:hypothetical protein